MLKKGDKKVIRGWAMYDWANSVYSLVITSTIFPIFYESISAIKTPEGEVITDLVFEATGLRNTALYSYTMSAAFLLVAIISPLLSGIADYTGSKKNYLMFFCYLGSAACIGLFFFEMNNLFFGMSMIFVACAAFCASLVFYDAYLPEIAEPKDHDRVSAQGYAMGYVGSVLLLLFNLAMVMMPEWFGIDPENKTLPARLSFLSVGIWWAGFAQFTFYRLPANLYGRKPKGDVIRKGYLELVKVWHELKQTKRLWRYLLAFFVFNTAVQTVMYMAATFAAKEVKQINGEGNIEPMSADSLIISILIIQLVAIVGAAFFSRLSGRIGNIKALMVSVVIWIGVCVAAYFVHFDTQFFVVAVVVGLVMGGIQSLSRSTYAKFLPDTINHTSYFSFYNVCYYLGTVLGTFAYGLAFQLTGTLRASIFAIGSFFVIGLIMLWFVPKEEVLIQRETEKASGY
jgi:UMF1 family MFS transporter